MPDGSSSLTRSLYSNRIQTMNVQKYERNLKSYFDLYVNSYGVFDERPIRKKTT